MKKSFTREQRQTIIYGILCIVIIIVITKKKRLTVNLEMPA